MRHCLWLALLGLLLIVPWARTSPTQPEEPRLKLSLPGYGRAISVVRCNGGEWTYAVAATVSEEVLLAMYVYDAHGNCVGRDEFTERATQKRRATDDCAVEWFPPITGFYTIEIRNQSLDSCTVQMAIQ